MALENVSTKYSVKSKWLIECVLFWFSLIKVEKTLNFGGMRFVSF